MTCLLNTKAMLKSLEQLLLAGNREEFLLAKAEYIRLTNKSYKNGKGMKNATDTN